MTVPGGKQSGSPSDAVSSHPAVIDRDSLNLPNLITLSRLLLAFVLFALIYVEALWITAAVLFVVAAATDALDGYIARKYGTITALGRILDPFVDKIIVCGAFVFLLDKKVFVDLETGQVEVWSGRQCLDGDHRHRPRNVRLESAGLPRTAGEGLFGECRRQVENGDPMRRRDGQLAVAQPEGESVVAQLSRPSRRAALDGRRRHGLQRHRLRATGNRVA